MKDKTASEKSSRNKNHFVLYESYQAPFDYDGLMSFHINHCVGDLEWFEESRMHRVIVANDKIGQITISNDHKNSQLIIEVDFPDKSILKEISMRIRNLFDLDSNPAVVSKAFNPDPVLKKLFKKHRGLRVPGAWDPFELAVSTILGQAVTVERGRALVSDLIEIVGISTNYIVNGKSAKLFPTPQEVIDADLTSLKTTSSRRNALKELSKAIINKELSLKSDQELELFIEKMVSIKGIGPWTANYIALKILQEKDAFPANDLIIARALKIHPLEIIETMRPWRGYVTILMWKSYAGVLKKTKAGIKK